MLPNYILKQFSLKNKKIHYGQNTNNSFGILNLNKSLLKAV